MQIELLYRPSNAVAKIALKPNETIIAEAGAMIAMSGDMNVKTTKYSRDGSGGILKGFRRLFSGENFFMNHFTASSQGGDLILGTDSMGDLITRTINGKFFVQAGSFVACENTIDIDTSWQGFKTLFSGESLFWVKLEGQGQVLVNSFGAIYEVDVKDTYIVDIGHIVAFEETLNFKIRKAGGSWATAILGGEGLVCEFQGNGKVYCQSHNDRSFGYALSPHLKEV